MEKWLKLAIEVQSIAQAGLTYTESVYDKERYERLREISAEMIAENSNLPVEKLKTYSVMKLAIKHRKWTPEVQFLKMIKFYLFTKTTTLGHFLGVGKMF